MGWAWSEESSRCSRGEKGVEDVCLSLNGLGADLRLSESLEVWGLSGSRSSLRVDLDEGLGIWAHQSWRGST